MLYLLHIKTKNVGTNIFTRIYFMFLIVHKVCTNYIIVIEFYTNNTSIIFRRVSEATKERARLLGRTIAKEGNQILYYFFHNFSPSWKIFLHFTKRRQIRTGAAAEETERCGY